MLEDVEEKTPPETRNGYRFALVIDRKRTHTVVRFVHPEQHHGDIQSHSGCLHPQSSTTALSLHVLPKLLALNEEDFAALVTSSAVLGTMTTKTFWKRLSMYLKRSAAAFYRNLTLPLCTAERPANTRNRGPFQAGPN